MKPSRDLSVEWSVKEEHWGSKRASTPEILRIQQPHLPHLRILPLPSLPKSEFQTFRSGFRVSRVVWVQWTKGMPASPTNALGGTKTSMAVGEMGSKVFGNSNSPKGKSHWGPVQVLWASTASPEQLHLHRGPSGHDMSDWRGYLGLPEKECKHQPRNLNKYWLNKWVMSDYPIQTGQQIRHTVIVGSPWTISIPTHVIHPLSPPWRKLQGFGVLASKPLNRSGRIPNPVNVRLGIRIKPAVKIYIYERPSST